MLKLKRHGFRVSNHQKFRFLSDSTTATMECTTIQTQNEATEKIYPHIQEPSESQLPIVRDPRYFISALLNCRNVSHIRRVHGEIAVNGMLHNLFVVNKLLYMYAYHKALNDAQTLFDEMTERDSVSWSVMVGGFAKIDDYFNCFRTFRESIRSEVLPDNFSLPFVIRSCMNTVDLKMGRLIHGVVFKFGLNLDQFVCAALVNMYAKCMAIGDARLLFDKMSRKDLVTWTVMIGAHAEFGNPNESLDVFDRMKEEGVILDKVAMVTVVNACAKLGAMHKARFVHDYIYENNFLLDVILGSAMIDMYSKCGCVGSAREIFDRMQVKNVISWSAMIAAYGYHGQGTKALDLFQMMLNTGILPNRITFVSLLYACSHAGLVDEGRRLFSSMLDEYGVTADVKHCTCMVDLLGRAGKLDEAMKFIENMTVKKDEGLWGAFLGACRVHGHIDMAEMAAKSLLELQPQNPGHYVLLSNIYAKAGKWADMAKIRDLMTQRRLKKITGWTWVEANNKIYRFSIADKSHPRFEEIYKILNTLSKKLELAGYTPDTNFVLHDVDEEVKLGILSTHSEKLAIAFGLIATAEGTPIRLTKNLRVCGDCHSFSKVVSAITQRVIIVRDANRFHHFKDGICSCGDYW